MLFYQGSEEIKKFLKEKGIRHGLAQDSVIEEYLKSEAFWGDPCQVAQGTAAEPGKDAQVIYCFEKDPLRIGVIKAGGGIDFKDKGEIPQFKEGSLLGEKIPLVKEKPGRDVYGETIAVEKAKDFPLIPGPGTQASADRLKIYAQRSGRPMVDSDGKVSIFNELKIPAAFLNSSLDVADKRRVVNGIYNHRYKLIFVAPERFATLPDPRQIVAFAPWRVFDG